MDNYKSNYHNSWALIIGINAYQKFPPLTYACNDASDIASVLVQELEFPVNNVTLLIDEQATRKGIMDEYTKFINIANNPDDRLLIFFAGHGITRHGINGDIGFLVPCDGESENYNSLIRWNELTKYAELIRAKHILFIMDACYSGLALETKRGSSFGTERFISDMLQRPVRQVITAGKADEIVADGGGGEGKNSIFTGYLLQGLKGEANDQTGVLTGNGLMSYVYQRVGQDSQSNQSPHYGPIFGDGDFVFREPEGLIFSDSLSTDLLVNTTPEMPSETSTEISKGRLSLATILGYGDPTHPNFGRNEWTNKLYESQYGTSTGRSFRKAFSWLSVIVEPNIFPPINIDVSLEVQRLRNYQSSDKKPQARLVTPRQARTTANSLILYNEKDNLGIIGNSNWESYMRILDTGSMEYATSHNVFHDWESERSFEYVKLIGTIWQFVFFAKEFLKYHNYEAGASITINLVGTRETTLVDFARGKGENNDTWRQPERTDFHYDFSKLKCHDINLKLDYQVILKSLNDSELHQLIIRTASTFGLAYNHQSSPRCFNYNTEVFPWKQYFNRLY